MKEITIEPIPFTVFEGCDGCGKKSDTLYIHRDLYLCPECAKSVYIKEVSGTKRTFWITEEEFERIYQDKPVII